MRGARAGLAAVYAGYLGLVAVLVFEPNADTASGSVAFVDDALRAVGAPASLGPAVIEPVANIVLFVPMGLLGVLLFPRSRWPRWAVIGFLASTGIELVQLLAMPGRSGTVVDVVTNTSGAVLGGLVGGFVVRRLNRSVPNLSRR